MKGEIFTITEDHLKLLARMNFYWQMMYDGAPAVDVKKPYGNTDALDHDIPEILGFKRGKNEEFIEEEIWKGKKIHEEMATVLQIVCDTQSVKTGIYIKEDWYSDWKPKE